MKSEYHKEDFTKNKYYKLSPYKEMEWWGWYDENGQCFFHKENGVAQIVVMNSECIGFTNHKIDRSYTSEVYLINNKMHRLDGPAIINYYEDGHKEYGYCILDIDVLENDFYTPGFIDAFILENS